MQPLQPAGTTPASIWSPPANPDSLAPGARLAPEVDAQTGARLSLEGQGDPVLLAIGVQLRTIRGSGVSVDDDGTQLDQITKNGEEAPALFAFEMDRVLQPFVDADVITVSDQTITAGPAAGNRASVLERVHRGEPGARRGGAEPTEER